MVSVFFQTRVNFIWRKSLYLSNFKQPNSSLAVCLHVDRFFNNDQMPVAHNDRDKDDSEGEHEEMDHLSIAHDSDKGGTSDGDSSEDSGSEDSSEMDEDECENRRSECLDDMIDLEKQFSFLKEQ